MKVVPLHTSPTVTDIPGQLRQMADAIEAGEVEAHSALFIVPQTGDWPLVYGWGDHLGDHGNIAVLELTKHWFIQDNVAR